MSINEMQNSPGWAERSRLEFIERVLFWRGWINRIDLVQAFGVSKPQASNDLVSYSTLSEGACRYEVRRKRYEAEPGFKPCLVIPRFWSDLEAIAGSVWDASIPLLAVPELPLRVASDEVCQQVSRAVFSNHAIQIRYWSANSGKAEKRFISPRALANDGLRVHVRAFCHNDKQFKDFVLPRIESVLESVPSDYADVEDTDWMQTVTLKIKANPTLAPVVRKTLEKDYGMKRGVLSLPVRKAMLLYTARRLGFIKFDSEKLPVLNEIGELQLMTIK